MSCLSLKEVLPWKRFLLMNILIIHTTAFSQQAPLLGAEITAIQNESIYSDKQQCYINKIPILPLIVYSQNPNRNLFIAAVDAAISRKCDVNEADPRTGFNALNLAILQHDPDLIKHLLENGADPSIKIHAPKEIFNDMTSIEFTNLLIAHIPAEKAEFIPIYEEILTLIK